MFYVYFLWSLKNQKVYVGKTKKDPKIREQEHLYGSNTWTKHNGPMRLLYYEMYNCEKDARQRELFYKTGFGKAIKKLIVEYLLKSGISSDG